MWNKGLTFEAIDTKLIQIADFEVENPELINMKIMSVIFILKTEQF